MTPDEKYQRAIEQGDPATAVVIGQYREGFVHGGYFYFMLNGAVSWVEEDQVRKSLKRMAY